MSTNFPSSIDSYVTKIVGDVIQEGHVNNLQDAMVATETKVGANSSVVTASHDYKLTHIPAQTATTKVTNLQADLLDGVHASATPTGDYLVIADSSGFLHTPSSAPDSDYEVANKKYVDDYSSLISGCHVYLSANQSVNSDAITIVNFNTEVFDNLSEFNNVTNYRFTATVTGKYLVCAMVSIGALAAAKRLDVMIYKNGAGYRFSYYQNAIAGEALSGVISEIIALSANDYIDLRAQHTHGSARNVLGTIAYSYMSIIRVI